MPKLRLVVGSLSLVAVALAVWQFGGFAQPDIAPPPPATSGSNDPATPVRGETGAAGLAPATTNEAPSIAAAEQRVAVPADASAAGVPAIVGRVVLADGKPAVGAKVHAAPGFAFANANGQMDFDTFEFGDFADLDEGLADPANMMKLVREHLAARVEVSTDSDGAFRVRAPGTSRGVGLRVLVPGQVILDRRVDRPQDKDVDAGTLVLSPAAVVAGRVLDPQGNPIAGARVSRVHEAEQKMLGNFEVDMPEVAEVEGLRGGEMTTTDAAGRFELAHLRPGEIALRARHTDHPTATSEPVPLEAGRAAREVVITMQRGGEIRGVVVGLPADTKDLQVAAAKKPRTDADPTGMMAMFGGELTEMLADMGLSAGERTATIDADGRFVLRGLARDTYRVWVARTGAGFAGNGVCSARVEAQPGGDVELRFEAGVNVSFTVVDAKTGAPVEKLWVQDRLRGGGGFLDMAQMPSNAKRAHYPGGVVTVANVRPKPKQKLSLTLEATGYGKFERTGIELPASGTLDLGTLRLEPAPVVRVTVVAAEGRAAIGDATVRVVSERTAASDALIRMGLGGGNGPSHGRTDRSGHCVLNRILAEAAVIEVDAKGYAPFVSEPITFAADGSGEFTAELHVGGRVDVTVVDDRDQPVAGAVVAHKAPRSSAATRKTDGAGVAHFERLAPGAHGFRLGDDDGPLAAMRAQVRVRVEGAGGAPDQEAPWQMVDVADRAVASLRLVEKPTATLRGIVRENGVPLEGARIAFREGPETRAQTEAEMGEEMMGEIFAAAGGASGRSGKTDADGRYELKNLSQGEHHLRITHRGRAQPTTARLSLRNGDNTLDVELDMTTVRGTVVDPQGQGIAGARIRVRALREGEDTMGEVSDAVESMLPGMSLGGSTIKSDAGGAFELRGVEPDVNLLVQVTAKGYAGTAVRTTVARGTTLPLAAIQLALAGKVKVTVAGAPAFGAVRAKWVGEGDAPPPVVQMLRKGKGTLDGLRAGPWELEFDGPDVEIGENASPQERAPRKRRVDVVAGQTLEVEL